MNAVEIGAAVKDTLMKILPFAEYFVKKTETKADDFLVDFFYGLLAEDPQRVAQYVEKGREIRAQKS